MIDVVTPDEMALIDAAAPVSTAVLVERAGASVARVARSMLGGTYGRRVVVLAGPGNNGADGRSAARRLRRSGVAVTVIEVGDHPAMLPDADLVIDAAFGTGLRRDWEAPDPGPALVLAVDIASGIDGSTGEERGHAMTADRTVTFAALKPGLVLGAGPERCGTVEVADIGLDTSGSTAALITDRDIVQAWPRRPRAAHKYHAAVWVIGGSPTMMGAPTLAARAALRCGSGYVRTSVPGCAAGTPGPTEAVGWPLDACGWGHAVIEPDDQLGSIVLGPGLGRSEATFDAVADVIGGCAVPLVIDGDALVVYADRRPRFAVPETTVLTPHDGELRTLLGTPPSADRMGTVRELAAQLGVTVLSKGPTTVIAAPDGRVRFVTSGDRRLATAGSGDVLSGMIGALLACGLDPIDAAAFAADAHGRVASHGHVVGLVAGDLPDLVADWLDDVLVG